MAMPNPPSGAPGSDQGPDRTVRTAAIAGGALLVVAVALGVVVVRSSGGDAQAPPAARPAPSSPASAAAPSPAPTTPLATSPAPSLSASVSASGMTPSAEAGPVQRWSGTIRLDGPRARRDLDAVPPRLSERDGEPDIRGDWLRAILKTEGTTQVALLPSGAKAGPSECRDAAGAGGARETELLHPGDVVCVVTGQGTIARLTVVKAHRTSRAPVVEVTATIWSAS